MASIKDVARYAGVSVGTVSRVINGAPNVGADNRARVERAVKELGYRPHSLAQSLRRRSTQTLGLLVPDIANPFFAELTRAVSRVASQRGYSLLLAVSDEDLETERVELEALVHRRVDGLILTPTIATKRLPTTAGVPIIAVDRRLPGVDTVASDHEGGMRDAVHYLVELGHVLVAFISGPLDAAVSESRARGWETVARPILNQAGIDARSYTASAQFDFESGYESARRFLRLKPQPTAIVCSSDQQAVGALRACADYGVSVPDDVSIVGFDDIALSNIVTPRLTTVAQDMSELGRIAVDRLLRKGSSTEAARARRLLVPTTLRIRDSSAEPPKRTSYPSGRQPQAARVAT